ncbi:NUDIX domain-containing protein [Patescibacteria group bacterium AH-259-L07]|nr:NUDIX domain-containing protein [Patescibacteria group bacterium AH-259-L07]
MERDQIVVDEAEDRMSVSVFLTDVFRPRNRHELLLSDRILLVWNKAKYDEEGEFVRKAGVGMPGGHVEPGEHYIDAAYRETEEEAIREEEEGEKTAIGIREKIVIINDRRLFERKRGYDRESEPEKGEDGKLIFKDHWHLRVGARLLIPPDEIVLEPESEDIEKAEFCYFERLPLGVYKSHKALIRDFYNRLRKKELFDDIFRQKS